MVCTPDTVSIEPLPLVLVFHGRGGSGVEMMGVTSLHTTWPQAIVVYLDGLTGTSSPFDPKGLKNGWQLNPYDMDNRDVDFVDLTLDLLQQNHNIDSQRIFAAGFSNGARFCGVLWALRGDRFKGFVFSSAQADTLIGQADVNNIFMSAGLRDDLVSFDSQAISAQYAIGKFDYNAYYEVIEQNSFNSLELRKTIDGFSLQTHIYDGGHEWPASLSGFIVNFFKSL